MGSFLSLPPNKTEMREQCRTSQMQSCKKMRMSSDDYYENSRIIPSLPDEISLQILARLPRVCYLSLKSVSQRWKTSLTSLELFQLRRELGTTEDWLYVLTKTEDGKLLWHALDPQSRKWQRLPLMPNVVSKEESRNALSRFHMWNVLGSSIKMADIVRGWLGWKDAFHRITLSGCAVGAVGGCLYVLGGFSRSTAVTSVWQYDPRINSWQEVNSMSTGRAFCKAGALKNKLYVAGGVSRDRDGLTPLCSAEAFDPLTGQWAQLSSMQFSNAVHFPIALLADMLKPIATGMTTYKGKLCVPQSLYSLPFFIDIGGEVYDPETGSWSEMPSGMGDGWPAKQAGTKLSAVVDGRLYALEPSSSLDGGIIKMYSDEEDAWKVVIPRVPLRDFTETESPYLLASLCDKLHLITRDENRNISVLQAVMEKNICSSSSSSSAPSSSTSSVNSASEISVREEEANYWKVIASEDFRSAELVSCEVLSV